MHQPANRGVIVALDGAPDLAKTKSPEGVMLLAAGAV
jgi:hypothetical protein